MSQECTESLVVATSCTTPNWWPDLHASSSSWCTNPPNLSSNTYCEEDVSVSTSFTNASNHSSLTVESSRCLVETEYTRQTAPADNHTRSLVLLNVGSTGALNTTQDARENFLDALSSKSPPANMFEPANDYLKKMDNNWELSNSASFNSFQKQFDGYSYSLIESGSLNKQSNLVSNWSTAPPDPEVSHHFDPQACNFSLNSNNFSSLSCYGHDLKVEDDDREVEAGGAIFRRPFNMNGIGNQMNLHNSIAGDGGKHYCALPDARSTHTRNFANFASCNGYLSKRLAHNNPSTPFLNSSSLSDSKRQHLEASSTPTISNSSTLTRSSGRGQGIANEGKKKRSEENSETVLKPKHGNSSVSSAKRQVPKVKMTDKITALQQIVSPFGKTDTASVLWETMGYIKFLQQQVQLLSDPYMKTNGAKDPWKGFDRTDRGDHVKIDLKSRGLCLVPVSCTPQAYRENNGSDYLTPTYKSCVYR